MIKSGVKLNNAYIYAMYEENTFDLDSELYSIKRLERSFDVEGGQAITFDHSDTLVHQNAANRPKPTLTPPKSTITPSNASTTSQKPVTKPPQVV